MTIQSKTAAGVATVGTRDDGQGHLQGAIWQPFARLPVGATYHAVPSAAATLAPPATAQMALLTMDPGAAMRWVTSLSATANGTLGLLLAAGGSYPEALELTGSAMLSKFSYALNAGESAQGRFYVEYYRFIL